MRPMNRIKQFFNYQHILQTLFYCFLLSSNLFSNCAFPKKWEVFSALSFFIRFVKCQSAATISPKLCEDPHISFISFAAPTTQCITCRALKFYCWALKLKTDTIFFPYERRCLNMNGMLSLRVSFLSLLWHRYGFLNLGAKTWESAIFADHLWLIAVKLVETPAFTIKQIILWQLVLSCWLALSHWCFPIPSLFTCFYFTDYIWHPLLLQFLSNLSWANPISALTPACKTLLSSLKHNAHRRGICKTLKKDMMLFDPWALPAEKCSPDLISNGKIFSNTTHFLGAPIQSCQCLCGCAGLLSGGSALHAGGDWGTGVIPSATSARHCCW